MNVPLPRYSSNKFYLNINTDIFSSRDTFFGNLILANIFGNLNLLNFTLANFLSFELTFILGDSFALWKKDCTFIWDIGDIYSRGIWQLGGLVQVARLGVPLRYKAFIGLEWWVAQLIGSELTEHWLSCCELSKHACSRCTEVFHRIREAIVNTKHFW